MLKHIYRVIILMAIFVASLFYFSRDIKEVVFHINNTTTMKDATFPLISIKTGDNTINMLHGYSGNIAANKIRESVIPLEDDKAFEVRFNKEALDIKKMNYEVREFTGNRLIETNSVSVFEEDGDIQSAKIKLNSNLTEGKEYAVKFTLITDKTEKIYYYQRIKYYQKTYLTDKLNFVMNFHQSILDKGKAEEIIKYLEPSSSADNSSLAYVNIHSSFDLISWNGLKPIALTEVVPVVKEIYVDTASIELDYYIQAEAAGVKEEYRVTEFYRVRYSYDRMYLLNYERHMESIFDINLANMAKNELKLGITNNPKVSYKADTKSSKLAFVRDGELWFYDLENNKVTRVFSFEQKNRDYLRDFYDQHDIRILNMDAEGNINFLVYGYMNRGEYEGKVAVILYRFIQAENRIEELVDIPTDEPYQSLKENLGELTYLSSRDIFYLHVYDTIYAYNITTRQMSVIASNITKKQIVVLDDLNYIAWQENADLKASKNIKLMNLETGETQTISAGSGYNIRLLDKIDNNIIYGFAKEKDITAMVDGSIIAPLSSVEIASVDRKILKKYKKNNYYVTGIAVKDNIIELYRIKKVQEEGSSTFTPAANDQIMNKEEIKSSIIGTVKVAQEQTGTEYYMTLPPGFAMKKLPKVTNTVHTVITQDPTVRLTDTVKKQIYYYPYITGGIEGVYENAADAIAVARDGIGVVLDSNRQLVWERGVKADAYTIPQFKNMSWSPSSGKTITACLKMILDYQGVPVSDKQLGNESSSAYYMLKTYSKYAPVRLTGAVLDDVLYYVSKGRPVLAMTDNKHAVIIYGYDTFNIMIIDPAKSTAEKIGIQDSTELFGNAGNVFLSYLE